MGVLNPFKPGDFIEVTPLVTQRGTHEDWGVLRGTALTETDRTGGAVFMMEPAKPVAAAMRDATSAHLTFNANEVNVRLLFSAETARIAGQS